MKGEIIISSESRTKAEEVKRYIQKKYNLLKVKEADRQNNWRIFQQKVKELNLTASEGEASKQAILSLQMQQLRKRRQKISKKNFESLRVIGRGAFGEVRLCRQKANGRIVAIKCLKKDEMIRKNQQNHLKAERDMLVRGGEWIVELYYSFQDYNYLYLVMQYLPGGDLMNLLIARNVIEQNEAKFYAAEILLALESIHKNNYIHRDLKPDNVLIDNKGHIKLSDFGLCKHINQNDIQTFTPNQTSRLNTSSTHRHRQLVFSAVGTPDYIAPQMLKRTGYNQLVDWWALGIMIYEMLIGYAPFSSQTNDQIYYKIENHKNYLYFPPQISISFEVIDLISRLLSEPDKRLGRNGSDEIKKHKWFRDINFQEIRSMRSPFVPDLDSALDTKYFDKYDESEPWIYDPYEPRNNYNFIGYTYKIEETEQRNIIGEQLQRIEKEKQKQKQKQKQKKIDMRKKKLPLEAWQKANIQKILVHDNLMKSQINTQRSKGRKSKSPLAQKDTNRLKTKGSTSKSPIRIDCKEKLGGLSRKAAPLNLNNISNLGGVYSTNDLNKCLTGRKSIKKAR